MSEQPIMRGPSTVAICEAARECESMAQAAQRLDLDDLPGLLLSRKALGDAWQRGRLLRQLQQFAEGPIYQKTVAERLGFDEARFKAMLAADPEAGDVWRQGRHEFFMRTKRAIMAGVEQGKSHCVRLVEQIIRAESGTSTTAEAVDFHRLSPTQFERGTGVHRQQLARWTNEHGLPINDDGSYSLPAFITWLRRAPVGKARSYRQKPGAVEARIIERVKQIVHEEITRQSDTESTGQ